MLHRHERSQRLNARRKFNAASLELRKTGILLIKPNKSPKMESCPYGLGKGETFWKNQSPIKRTEE